MEETNTSKYFDYSLPLKWIICLFTIIGFLYFFISKIIPSGFLGKTKNSKSDLAKYYKVNIKTFNKWSIFWQNSYGILTNYPKRKLLSTIETGYIIYKLGNPDDFPVLSKKDIIEQGAGSYKSLRESIKKYPDRFGIQYEDFLRMKKFPPAIAKKIKKQYG